jgi:signal peptidase II
VAGGAAGNLVDRIRSPRGVVDFLDIGIGTLRWPTFNVADIAVSCGAVALAISLWIEDSRQARHEAASAG